MATSARNADTLRAQVKEVEKGELISRLSLLISEGEAIRQGEIRDTLVFWRTIT